MSSRTLFFLIAVAVFGILVLGYVVVAGTGSNTLNDIDVAAPPDSSADDAARAKARSEGASLTDPGGSLRKTLVEGDVISRKVGPLGKALILALDATGSERRVEADASGHFVVTGFGNEVRELIVSAPGHSQKRLVRVPAGSKLEITLEPAVPFRGRVLDSAGTPLYEARVRLHPVGRAEIRPLTIFTNRDGEFSSEVVAPGRYDAVVTHDDVAPWIDVGLVVPHPNGLTKDFRLLPAKTLTGQVITTERQPVPGAEITVTWPVVADRPLPFVETLGPFAADGDGRFAIKGLAPGQVRVRARAYGHGGVELVHDVNQSDSMTVVLLPSVKIEGRVVAPDGTGVANARVVIVPDAALDRKRFAETAAFLFRATPFEDSTGVSWPSVTADLKGRFTLFGLPAGARGFLEAHDVEQRWAQSARSPVDISTPGTVTMTLTLKEGKRVSGRVVGLRDEPLAESRVVYGETWVLTGADGGFTLPPLPLGERVLSVFHPLHALARVPVDVGSDEASNLTIVLDRLERLNGRLVDDQGRPVSTGFVQVLATDGKFLRATTPDFEGKFVVGGFDNKQVTVVVHAQGFRSAREENVATGDVPLVLRLESKPFEAQGDVVAAVVDAESGTPVTVERILGVPPSQVQAVAGAFMIQNLEPATYTLRVQAPGYQQRTFERIVVEPGARVELPLVRLSRSYPLRLYARALHRLAKDAKVRVSLVELDGAGNPPEFLIAEPAEIPARFRPVVGPSGAIFDFSQLRSGRYRIAATANGAAPAAVDITIPAPGNSAALELLPR